MSHRTTMDYERVRRLATQIAEAAGELEQGRARVAAIPAGGFTLPVSFPGGGGGFPVSTLFGNTDDARACHAAYLEAGSVGVTAVQDLGAALSADEGRLHQVISCFQQADQESADQLCAAMGDNLNVFTTHVHSGESGSRIDDVERADQINTAVNALAENPGSTVFTGDLNVDYDSSDPEPPPESADAVWRLENELDFENAGDAAGPTANYGEGGQIDYVFTSPDLVPDSGNAQNVDGDPEGHKDLSDHDGIAVDIDIPRW